MTTNCTTHTATVHASRTHADGRIVPACFSNTQVANLHYAAPTERGVTCKNCLAGAEAKVTPSTYAATSAKVAAEKPAVAATIALAATVGPVQIVRHADEDGVVWTLHTSGPAFFAAFTLKEAKAAAAR